DPAGTVAAMADAASHPVQTLKDMVGWDDWASGNGSRALGKLTGDVIVGFGIGKLAKLGRERLHGDDDNATPRDHPGGAPAPAPPRPVYGPTKNRVKLRDQTKRDIFRDAERTPDGDFIGANSRDRIPAQHNPDGSLVRINPDTGR